MFEFNNDFEEEMKKNEKRSIFMKIIDKIFS